MDRAGMEGSKDSPTMAGRTKENCMVIDFEEEEFYKMPAFCEWVQIQKAVLQIISWAMQRALYMDSVRLATVVFPASFFIFLISVFKDHTSKGDVASRLRCSHITTATAMSIGNRVNKIACLGNIRLSVTDLYLRDNIVPARCRSRPSFIPSTSK